MSIRFEGPAVFVADMAAARRFYEELLGQTVQFAVADAYTAYAGGMSLWTAASASEMIHGCTTTEPIGRQGRNNFELYFETDAIEQSWETIDAADVPVVHGVREMPWSQRCFRIQDPDGHLVEVAEPMTMVIKRLLDSGLPAQEVADRTMAPLEMVQAVAGGK